MATIGGSGPNERPASSRGSFILRVWRGRLIAQKWPRKRPGKATKYVQSLRDRMKAAMAIVTRTSARERTAVKTMLETYNQKNKGLTGDAAIRERDWLYMWATRPPIGILREDGKKIWPAYVVQDASEALDWLLPVAGSLLTRGPDGWRPTQPAQPGWVCKITNDTVRPDCAKPCQFSGSIEQIGGYAP